MLKKTAIEYFGSQAEICRRLEISSAAVAKWGEVVPLESATAIEIHTNGDVPVVRSMYPNLARAIELAELHPTKHATA
jgi:hypothetical protein